MVEISKTDYAIYRSTRLNMLFDYLKDIQSYREKKYTKFTPRKELRAALIKLFCD